MKFVSSVSTYLKYTKQATIETFWRQASASPERTKG